MRVDDKIINSGDYMTVLRPVWRMVQIYEGYQEYNEQMLKFSIAQRNLYAGHWYLSEVFNGGHAQFYFNSTGVLWKDALQGFRAMGIDLVAKILHESANRFGTEPSLDRVARQEQMEKADLRFEDLDQKLFDLDKKICIASEFAPYVRKNREAFYFPRIVR